MMEVPDRIISLRLEVEGVMLYVALQVGCHIEEKDEIWSKVVNISEGLRQAQEVHRSI